jgi:16S rRNA (guanine966-N2)-methyltransferase
LSRGAAKATFVESARDAIKSLEQNIDSTGFRDKCEVLWADVGATISRSAPERMDLIFVDPPYATTPAAVQGTLEDLVMGGFLADDGRVVLHRPQRERQLHPLGLKLDWRREYGQSAVHIFVHDEEEG